jgi:hypothetical protein
MIWKTTLTELPILESFELVGVGERRVKNNIITI